jgi:tRNA-dihydrouridine synthase 1
MTLLAHRYLDIVASLRTPTGNSAMKSHLFRLLKPVLDKQPDETLRIEIAKSRDVEELRAVVRTIEAILKVSPGSASFTSLNPPPSYLTCGKDVS